MKAILSIFLGLLSASGLLELCSRYRFGQGLVSLARDIASPEEVAEHRRDWGFEGAHRLDHAREFHDGMKEKMRAVKVCHVHCGMNVTCHHECPKPWAHLQEKCEAAKPIVACHRACHHDHACHEKCPLPKCPKMAEKVQKTLQCHAACGNDRGCHHACPHPAWQLLKKCDTLEKVMTCHKGCGFDGACHHHCPKMMEIWGRRQGPFGNWHPFGHHHGHDHHEHGHHEHGHHHGHGHHHEHDHHEDWNPVVINV